MNNKVAAVNIINNLYNSIKKRNKENSNGKSSDLYKGI